ncbi:hypothetical protein Ahy_A09g044613 [Arachis hypogaea]|uniref:TIR domain-containing protein n=1 Tax=Arachis hypogaea TaxID=3818 RepID=A0A445BKM9_ARAHY|nr:hypothetical protein Ahy_A09g044613 [Arachis hypogaea]
MKNDTILTEPVLSRFDSTYRFSLSSTWVKFYQWLYCFCNYVDPSHVRYQLGSYSEAFKKHLQNNKKAEVQKWREALTVAANLEGLDSHSYRDEIEFIQNIVKDGTDSIESIVFDMSQIADL